MSNSKFDQMIQSLEKATSKLTRLSEEIKKPSHLIPDMLLQEVIRKCMFLEMEFYRGEILVNFICKPAIDCMFVLYVGSECQEFRDWLEEEYDTVYDSERLWEDEAPYQLRDYGEQYVIEHIHALEFSEP